MPIPKPPVTAYERSRVFSEKRLEALRRSLSTIELGGDVILTCGSYARREASESSDIDFYFVTEKNYGGKGAKAAVQAVPWARDAEAAILKVTQVAPSRNGAFAQVERRSTMSYNIGGDEDSNQKITRRILLLLEGEWLAGVESFRTLRREILDKYINDKISDGQIALFLLNDIIRYYRTIAVDYEFKTNQLTPPKPWGVRNIKLVFSRKLLYASGVFSVAETADLHSDKKIKLLEDLFDLPVIDRMSRICGNQSFAPVLKLYECFLEKLENVQIRTHLNGLDRGDRDDPIFREMKNDGHKFTRELLKLFDRTFDCTHPIRRSILF